MYKFNYKSVQNMQCLVTQILLNNMLKFHSDMAKQKSLEYKSAVLDSPQVFRNGFFVEIQVHSL